MRTTAAPRLRPILIALSSSLIVASVISTTPARAVTPSAFVRVNQVGYPTASAKRAFLMSSDVETGAVFDVKDAGNATVFSAAVGSDLGSWSSAFPHVYALDFTAFATPGTYSIVVTAPIPASSPPFTIGRARACMGWP